MNTATEHAVCEYCEEARPDVAAVTYSDEWGEHDADLCERCTYR